MLNLVKTIYKTLVITCLLRSYASRAKRGLFINIDIPYPYTILPTPDKGVIENRVRFK